MRRLIFGRGEPHIEQPNCVGGTTYDVTSGKCVVPPRPECGVGTMYDDTSHTCVLVHQQGRTAHPNLVSIGHNPDRDFDRGKDTMQDNTEEKLRELRHILKENLNRIQGLEKNEGHIKYVEQIRDTDTAECPQGGCHIRNVRVATCDGGGCDIANVKKTVTCNGGGCSITGVGASASCDAGNCKLTKVPKASCKDGGCSFLQIDHAASCDGGRCSFLSVPTAICAKGLCNFTHVGEAVCSGGYCEFNNVVKAHCGDEKRRKTCQFNNNLIGYPAIGTTREGESKFPIKMLDATLTSGKT